MPTQLASYDVAVGVTYLKRKREALMKQIEAGQYNEDYKMARIFII
ncbi:hypothetical protein [Clostridium tyrobutyricum]|nr:hypothetical protein [Clostridium tyrobutyricum]